MYELTKQILQNHNDRFSRIEPHDIEDEDSADLLWLVSTPADGISEGEVLEISPAQADGSVYFVALNLAHRVGGWPTSWRFAGSRDECLSAIGEILESHPTVN